MKRLAIALALSVLTIIAADAAFVWVLEGGRREGL